MRRSVVMVGAAAAVAGVAALVARSRGAFSIDAPGAMPGRQGSRVNTWLNRPVYRLVADALELEADDELLDVACGWGAFLMEQGSHVRYVAGLDRSAAKVALARERLAARIAAGTADVACGDAGALPWDDGRFTAVCCMDAFPFFPDSVQALAEMRRVLRPGGRAVVQMGIKVREEAEPLEGSAPASERPLDVRKIRDVLRRALSWTKADVVRMMAAAGFEDVSISYGRLGGDNRLGNLIMRVLTGTDEGTLVRGVRPVPAHARDEEQAREPVAVG